MTSLKGDRIRVYDEKKVVPTKNQSQKVGARYVAFKLGSGFTQDLNKEQGLLAQVVRAHP